MLAKAALMTKVTVWFKVLVFFKGWGSLGVFLFKIVTFSGKVPHPLVVFILKTYWGDRYQDMASLSNRYFMERAFFFLFIAKQIKAGWHRTSLRPEKRNRFERVNLCLIVSITKLLIKARVIIYCMGGEGEFGCVTIIFSDLPVRLCSIFMTSPHWQLICTQFFCSPPFKLCWRRLIHPCIPPGNHVSPPKFLRPLPPGWWLVTNQIRTWPQALSFSLPLLSFF